MKRLIGAMGALAIAAAAQATDSARISVPQEEFRHVLEAYRLVLANHVEPADERKLLQDAARGMLASLDPHSAFLDKDDLADMERMAAGHYVGIGIEVQVAPGRIVVHGVREGGPAERAGIRAGDAIVAVDGAALAGLREAAVTRLMRGAPGSKVALTLAARGAEPARTVEVIRSDLRSDTVSSQRVAPGIARIRIAEFGATTTTELIDALNAFAASEAPRAIILDLRNDPGGFLPAAVGVAGVFLPEGAVVYSSQGRSAAVNATVAVSDEAFGDAGGRRPAFARSVPLAVLINGASASAAELVAGALQDHGRAKVIGTPSFGKGTIQSVIPVSEDAAVKLTVARYLTPAGHEVQGRGIQPDITVKPLAADGAMPALRETDLPNHLVFGQGGEGEAERAPVEDSKGFGTPEDRSLQAALGVLDRVTSAEENPSSLQRQGPIARSH